MSDFIHQFEAGTGEQTVLALHGTGGTERDLVPLARSLFPAANILSPRGKVSERGANRFFKRLAEGVFDLNDLHQQTDDLADFVIDSATKYAFDPAQVWALGYSNGANIAASLLLQRAETLSGAVLLRAMTPFEPPIVPNLVGKRIFLASGRFDPLVPVVNIENLSRLFREGGANVELRFQNAGHDLTREELEAIKQWL
ncbi:putative hydrolase MhqD [Abditibacteriota bacterium]|nr:putative hydrolase MhqD [Abditibacteriota bacterium]